MSTYGNEPHDPNGPTPGESVPPPGGEIPSPPPAYGQPSYGMPGEGQPAYGQPAYGQPAYGAGQTGQPGFGTPSAPYAHWIKRVGASLIDWLIIYIPAMVVILVVNSNLLGNVVQLALFIWIVVWMQGTTGYTFGKQVLGIKLVNEQTGQPIGPAMSFVRQIAHFLDALACLVGYLWPLWDAKRQTFADKLLTTIVIEQPKS